MNEDNGQPNPRRLYRDTENRVFCGVCSGLADYFGFGVCATRIVTVMGCFFFPLILFAYFALCLLVPKKPRNMYKSPREEMFWRSVRRSPRATFSKVRHKFREMEVRLQRLERYVTSPRFNLDQEFKDLEG